MTGMMSSMGSMMGGGMMSGGMMGGMMAPWWFLGWALVALVAVGMVAGVVWAVRRPGGSAPQGEQPLEILERRFASGEISAEQFESMKRQVSGD